MRNRKNIKKNSGITIIALVITIVVLLILAGISITSFVGDKGLFNETRDMKDNIEDLQNQTIDDLHSIANELASSGGGALNPDNPDPEDPDNPTPVNPPEEVPIENIKSDWETINKIANKIAKDNNITNESETATVIVEDKQYTIGIGDIFEVKYNEEPKRVRVLGFKYDDLVKTGIETYGEGTVGNKASISFEFLDYLGTYSMLNVSSDGYAHNINGWAATKMRKYINGYSSSDEVQNIEIGGVGTKLNNNSCIKQVKKQYIKTYNNADTVSMSYDYLWLLSCSEVFHDGYGDTGPNSKTEEGEQYLFYKVKAKESHNESSTARQKRSYSADHWWLRSPSYWTNRYFCYVTSQGKSGNSWEAYDTEPVMPGFCI